MLAGDFAGAALSASASLTHWLLLPDRSSPSRRMKAPRGGFGTAGEEGDAVVVDMRQLRGEAEEWSRRAITHRGVANRTGAAGRNELCCDCSDARAAMRVRVAAAAEWMRRAASGAAAVVDRATRATSCMQPGMGV